MSAITAKTEQEIKTVLAEKKEALRSFRFGVSGAKVKNVKMARNLRKDIARLLTKLSVLKRNEK